MTTDDRLGRYHDADDLVLSVAEVAQLLRAVPGHEAATLSDVIRLVEAGRLEHHADPAGLPGHSRFSVRMVRRFLGEEPEPVEEDDAPPPSGIGNSLKPVRVPEPRPVHHIMSRGRPIPSATRHAELLEEYRSGLRGPDASDLDVPAGA